jgi:Glycosyl transferases group 1
MIGYPHFVNMLAPVLSSDEFCFEPTENHNVLARVWEYARASAVYCMHGVATRFRGGELALLLGRPVVMHWIGTDVLVARSAHTQGLFARKLVDSCVHWCEVPWISEELRSMGIWADVVPLASTLIPEEPPVLPAEFRVLTYLGNRPDFYGYQAIRRLALEFPHLPFIVVGDSGLRNEDVPPNLTLLGRVSNISHQYAQASVLIRMTDHDGLSFMVLEALAHGRHVVWSYPFEGCMRATNYDMLRCHVETLVRQHQQGELTLNAAGLGFVRREYDPSQIASNIRRRMLGVIENGAAGRK